jgi:glycosyltransferase involved in cell wall biosynthesis
VEEKRNDSQTKSCPFCREPIREDALKCRYCGEFIDGEVERCMDSVRTKLPEGMKISIVIPVFNEKDTIRTILAAVKAVALPKEIIIVDDFSTDGTRDTLETINDSDVRIFYHEYNQGKGAALRTGFSKVCGDIVIIQDADLEYNPQEYFRLVRPIVEGKADVVYGSRFIGASHRVLLFWHYLGNMFLTLLSNAFTNLNLTDMETCYKVARAEVIKDIKIRSNRFGVEPELTAKFAKKHCRIYEIPISYAGRDYTEGKKIGWKDGFSAIWCIIKFRFTD